jgi:hypothetical protein
VGFGKARAPMVHGGGFRDLRRGVARSGIARHGAVWLGMARAPMVRL